MVQSIMSYTSVSYTMVWFPVYLSFFDLAENLDVFHSFRKCVTTILLLLILSLSSVWNSNYIFIKFSLCSICLVISLGIFHPFFSPCVN